MCDFASALYTRDGQLRYVEGVHSHTQIAERLGLRDAQDAFRPAPYAKVQLVPDWDWADVATNLSAWRWSVEGARPDWFDEAAERDARVKMELMVRDLYVVTEGEHARSGVFWLLAAGTAVVHVVGQAGGWCRAYGSATLNATGQAGGWCRASGTATLNATGQAGGECRAYGSATLNATGQAGGWCRASGTATLNRNPTSTQTKRSK